MKDLLIKKRTYSLLKWMPILAITLTIAVSSCKKATDPTPTTTTTVTPSNAPQNANNSGHTNTEVNNWIYSTMKTNYFWTDYMPAITSTDLTQDPGDLNTEQGYFYSLLYRKDTIDRNSWIQNIVDLQNVLSHQSTQVFGFSRKNYSYGTGNSIAYSVTYVIKGSAADKAGLQRGDNIIAINGTPITKDNYTTLVSAANTDVFTLADFNGTNFVANGKTITATKADVTENTVAVSKVITKGTKKIGYLLYTGFVSNYDADMRNVFASFKSQGVTEMVLDLRLNGGGSVNSSAILASLIVKNPSSSNLMFKYEENPAKTAADLKSYGPNYLSNYFTNESNNLNLSRLYVLVSGGSASASELLINNLRPYMSVYLVGDQTYGKNEFSTTFTDSRWAWGMQPLIGRTVNSKGESAYGVTLQNGKWIYQGGILPDYAVSDNTLPFKPFGDESETLLAKAISLITGQDMTQNLRQSATFEANSMNRLHISDDPSRNRYNMLAEKFKK